MNSRLIVDESLPALGLIFLVKNLAGHSRSQIQKLIKGGNITVNDEKYQPTIGLKRRCSYYCFFKRARTGKRAVNRDYRGNSGIRRH